MRAFVKTLDYRKPSSENLYKNYCYLNFSKVNEKEGLSIIHVSSLVTNVNVDIQLLQTNKQISHSIVTILEHTLS